MNLAWTNSCSDPSRVQEIILSCIYPREKKGRYTNKRAHKNLPSNLQIEKGQGCTCWWCPIQVSRAHRSCQSASCYKYFSVLPEDTLWFVGFQLDRLVMIYGIWWRNMLSSLLTPQGGNNPELCYVLSPGVSSMADPWSSLMANTTDPNPLFPHCSHSHDSQGTSGCHFFHTLFNFYPVFFFERHNCAAWFLPNLIQARVIWRGNRNWENVSIRFVCRKSHCGIFLVNGWYGRAQPTAQMPLSGIRK